MVVKYVVPYKDFHFNNFLKKKLKPLSIREENACVTFSDGMSHRLVTSQWSFSLTTTEASDFSSLSTNCSHLFGV